MTTRVNEQYLRDKILEILERYSDEETLNKLPEGPAKKLTKGLIQALEEFEKELEKELEKESQQDRPPR